MCTLDKRVRWIFIFNKVCTDNVFRFMPSVLTATAIFSRVFFQLLQFNSALSVSFHINFHEKLFKSSLTVAWFSWTNRNSLLHIATNEIASFYVGNRLHQMAIFAFGWLSSNEIFKKKSCSSLFLYYIKQIDSMFSCVCSVTQRASKCGKNIFDTLGYCLVCHFFVLITFWRHLWSVTEQTPGNMESIC